MRNFATVEISEDDHDMGVSIKTEHKVDDLGLPLFQETSIYT